MPPRSSIGKRIVRRPASYEEEPDTDDGERLARVIVRISHSCSKEEPAAIKGEAIGALKTLFYDDAPSSHAGVFLTIVTAASLSGLLITASMLNRAAT